MKLIREDISNTSLLVEGTGDNKRMYITGPFLQAEKRNRNNRVYPQHIMDAAVKKYKSEYIDQKRALGELNHPAEPVVNPERAAIITESLTKDGNYYVGKAKVLSTPCGKIVEELLKDGVKIGVSSRGLGTLKTTSGYNQVQEDFMLTTAADVVFDPSAQTAFVEGIYEGANWIFDSGLIRAQTMEEAQAELRTAKKAELYDTKLKIMETFFKSL